jgi:phage terminase large subunit GpA-like protein
MISHPDQLDALDAMDERLRALWEPPAIIKPSDWARANLWITMGARKGPCEPDPYQIEIMDCMMDPDVREVIYIKPVQIGWSTILNAVVGWGLDVHAMEMLMVQPSQGTAEEYAKDRIQPMIDHCESLSGLAIPATNRRSGSTVRKKRFRNGAYLVIASATAPKELRSYSSRMILLDERSAYRVDVGGEGDPGKIARGRGETYEDLVIFQGSTPAMPRGIDPTEQDYFKGSMAQYFVPCPQCNGMQTLVWRDEGGQYRLLYELDSKRKVIPGSTFYVCKHCGHPIEERWKRPMVGAGDWIHEHPEVRKVRSFRNNSLYSVVKDNWEQLAQEWVDAQTSPSELKTFINLKLAETWEEKGDALEKGLLQSRLESYERGRVPNGAGVIITTCDVQKDRLEAKHTAFGEGEEAWIVDYRAFYGDTSQPEVFEEFDAWLLQPLHHATSGRHMPLDLVLVDARYNQAAVYEFIMPRQSLARRCFACVGEDYIDRPGMAKESTTRKARVKLFVIATDSSKKKAMGALQRLHPGPRYVHLPDWVPDEYLDQLTSEKLEQRIDPRTRKVSTRWIKTRDRNEAWDLMHMAHAGLWILQNILGPIRYSDLGSLAKGAALEIRNADDPEHLARGTSPKGRRLLSPGPFKK